MAKLLFHKKENTPEGDIIEEKIWKVKKSEEFPHRVKYRLVYIHKNKRIIGYDNERSKGDHKHYFDKKEKYNFVDVEQLLCDFEIDIEKIRRDLHDS